LWEKLAEEGAATANRGEAGQTVPWAGADEVQSKPGKLCRRIGKKREKIRREKCQAWRGGILIRKGGDIEKEYSTWILKVSHERWPG